MGLAVIVDGKVVYGDEQELKNAQMREVRQELDRLTTDVERLVAALEAAKETLEPVLTEMHTQERMTQPAHQETSKAFDTVVSGSNVFDTVPDKPHPRHRHRS
jgi:chromosome segregation ATPase